MSTGYYPYTTQNRQEIIQMMELLAMDPKVLQKFLNDRRVFLESYTNKEGESLSKSTIGAFCYDVNRLNVQFVLDREEGTGMAIETKGESAALVIPKTQVNPKFADGTPFVTHNVYIDGWIKADNQGGSLELNTKTERKSPDTDADTTKNLPPIECTIVDAISIDYSDRITLRGDKTIVIGPELRAHARFHWKQRRCQWRCTG